MTILGLQFSGLGLLSSSYNLFPIPNGARANVDPRFPRTIVGMVVGKKTVPGTGVSDSRVPCSHVPGGLYHPDRMRAYFRRVFN